MKKPNLKQVRFPIGHVVRYGNGDTALMRIESYNIVGDTQDDVHYYGAHCMGGKIAGYGLRVVAATVADLHEWCRHEKERK